MMPTAVVATVPHVLADGKGQFLGVDWGAFLVVFVVSFVVAVAIVVLYSLALRLLAVGSPDDTVSDGAGSASEAGAVVSGERGDRPVAATVGGYFFLAVGAAAVLYAVYLIIPQFH